ncbi:Gfo/Idh/MocA family protein [Alicyclobacillus acidiphilus]|uniref:Gfo/Idh/MocA family protein n=1 Tax=Alicyclobacillus acidiphilus TaxID=182455 RepID=UPI00082FBDBD|nr:Gfo/Idh/MocA family oxidoreductase [Alicyclobacillus acidiphilus]
MARPKVGIIGCGNISEIYFKNCQAFGMDVVACADIDLERAKSRAAQFNVPVGCSVDELLANPDVEVVINLTIPSAHAEVSRRALAAGKHVHSEKPLALTVEEGRELISFAQQQNRRVGSAPDTFLGSHLQTSRKVIDDGWIGKPIGATAFMMSHGPERWHPNPDFFYQPGGGPMFDMGPYYLTALVHLLGPVQRLTGMTQVSFPERVVTSEPRFGQSIQVNTPTHVTGILQFASGAIGNILTSFDVWHSELPRIEIYGTEGTLSVPDPNNFGGTVRVRRHDAKEWTEVAPLFGFQENSRGLAVADLMDAVRTNRLHRANGDLMLHVVELMEGIHVSANAGRHYEMTTTCERPSPWPLGFDETQLRLSFFR